MERESGRIALTHEVIKARKVGQTPSNGKSTGFVSFLKGMQRILGATCERSRSLGKYLYERLQALRAAVKDRLEESRVI